jgi:hypothetical protein
MDKVRTLTSNFEKVQDEELTLATVMVKWRKVNSY